jgi:hypothetical protein
LATLVSGVGPEPVWVSGGATKVIAFVGFVANTMPIPTQSQSPQ